MNMEQLVGQEMGGRGRGTTRTVMYRRKNPTAIQSYWVSGLCPSSGILNTWVP
jgi:hypothetical protein